MARITGYLNKIIGLSLIFKISSIYSSEVYICENTLSKNGNIGGFTVDQVILKDTGSIISNYEIQSNHSTQVYKNGSWFWKKSEDSKFKKVNLKKVREEFSIPDLQVRLRYNHKSLRELDVSPVLYPEKTKYFPKLKIELINESLYAHKTFTLPKGHKAIQSSNYYLEHSTVYQIPTRIRYRLKSAFIQERLMCERDRELKREKVIISKSIDLSNNYAQWPESLSPLKESIQKILIENYLQDKITLEEFNKQISKLPKYNLSKILRTSLVDTKLFSKERLSSLLEKTNNIKSTSQLTLVESISKNETLLIKERVFNSEHAIEKNAFNFDDFIPPTVIKNVYLTVSENDQINFYFDSSAIKDLIKIGPINPLSLYKKNSKKKLSKCTNQLLMHLSEYERKSFVFKRQSNDLVVRDILLRERASRKYPVEEFVLTNNCRGPGNFEFEWPGIVKGHFYIPLKIINEIINMKEFYVEERMAKFYDTKEGIISENGFDIRDFFLSLWSKSQEKDYRWKSFGNFNKASRNCSIGIIEKDLAKSFKDYQDVSFKYEYGRIEYDQFPSETRRKAGYNKVSTPLVYVKTPCSNKEAKFSSPKHFYPPKMNYLENSKKYWKKKTCEIVPINFFNYKDLIDYKVHLSKFEVDGVYVGQNREDSPVETNAHDISLLKNDKVRVPYDFKNIYSFKKISISKNNKFLSIRLKGDINFQISNISISELISQNKQVRYKSRLRPWATDNVWGINKLVGIRPFDLSNNYESAPESMNDTFSLFYDKDQSILNHHETDIGIEQWMLRYINNKIVLDLISHERITPVARIVIDYQL